MLAAPRAPSAQRSDTGPQLAVADGMAEAMRCVLLPQLVEA